MHVAELLVAHRLGGFLRAHMDAFPGSACGSRAFGWTAPCLHSAFDFALFAFYGLEQGKWHFFATTAFVHTKA